MGTHPIFESDFDCLTDYPTNFEVMAIMRLPKFIMMPIHNTFFKGSVIPYATFIGLQVAALEFVYAPLMEDWYYNSLNKGRNLSDIMPRIIKFEAEQKAKAAAEEEEEEDDDE